MTRTPMTNDMVAERLRFARRRMMELLALNGGDLAGADPAERQQLVQEFFFHLVGATEVLAQLVAEARDLRMDPKDVSVHKVSCRLRATDPVRSALASLHCSTRGKPLPADPYSDDGYIFRILNYRHQVTHRARNPFLFKLGFGSAAGLTRSAHLFLDPREPDRGGSMHSAEHEMQHMLGLIETRCRQILAWL